MTEAGAALGGTGRSVERLSATVAREICCVAWRRGGAVVWCASTAHCQGSLGGVRQSQGAIDPGKVYDHGDPLRLRRIPGALQEPTRDGDTASPVLSHVPLRKASAQQLAERDGKRWTLDTMLQEVTETLPCAVNALGSPQAALLGLCLALMASQAVAVMQAAWRAVHGHETVHQDISASSLA